MRYWCSGSELYLCHSVPNCALSSSIVVVIMFVLISVYIFICLCFFLQCLPLFVFIAVVKDFSKCVCCSASYIHSVDIICKYLSVAPVSSEVNPIVWVSCSQKWNLPLPVPGQERLGCSHCWCNLIRLFTFFVQEYGLSVFYYDDVGSQILTWQ